MFFDFIVVRNYYFVMSKLTFPCIAHACWYQKKKMFFDFRVASKLLLRDVKFNFSVCLSEYSGVVQNVACVFFRVILLLFRSYPSAGVLYKMGKKNGLLKNKIFLPRSGESSKAP